MQKGIIKVNHKHVDELKSALTLIEKINNKKVIVKSLGVSGILNKAEQRYLKWGEKYATNDTSINGIW